MGGEHTCALLNTGGVKCWGYNYYGQLGDGTTTNRYIPVSVSSLTSGVTAISAGRYHTCALLNTGGVKCWGYNGTGQLGNGYNNDRSTPVDVSGLTAGVTAISAAHGHTCALLNTGGVKCWGNNSYGQLGNGTTSNRYTPVSVSGLITGVNAIAAGGGYTCALLNTGGVKCWGQNSYGQLGDGSTTDRYTAVSVSGLASGVTAISAGSLHTCALLNTGGVKCWGRNYYGQLGDVSTTDRYAPVSVSGLTAGVNAIAADGGRTCALLNSGALKCWGDNYYGQLGDGSSSNQLTPTSVVQIN
jgi:alpha-tubulin suppressor-like RCC1 family protein